LGQVGRIQNFENVDGGWLPSPVCHGVLLDEGGHQLADHQPRFQLVGILEGNQEGRDTLALGLHELDAEGFVAHVRYDVFQRHLPAILRIEIERGPGDDFSEDLAAQNLPLQFGEAI